MKYSQIERDRLNNTHIEALKKFNLSEIENFKSKVGIPDIPCRLKEIILGVGVRFTGIRLLTYDAFDQKFPATAMPDSTAVKTGEKNEKTGFPVLYVYTPDLAGIAQRIADKQKKFGNLKRLGSYLTGKRYELQVTETFENFVLNELPAEIPFVVSFDGSRERVANLLYKENSKLYGDTEGDIFAVIHTYRGEPMLTVFVPEHDFRKEFATQLVKKLAISEELATQISAALHHDVYYSVMDVNVDFEKYATKMAYLLKVNPGDTVTDLIQGPIDVVRGVCRDKVAIDIDDEMPSAILVGENKLNVFVPTAR